MPITTVAEHYGLAVPDEDMRALTAAMEESLLLVDQALELERRLEAIFDSIAAIADLGTGDELAICRELFDMKEAPLGPS